MSKSRQHAFDEAVDALHDQIHAPKADIAGVSQEDMTWNDSCLGCGRTGEKCTRRAHAGIPYRASCPGRDLRVPRGPRRQASAVRSGPVPGSMTAPRDGPRPPDSAVLRGCALACRDRGARPAAACLRDKSEVQFGCSRLRLVSWLLRHRRRGEHSAPESDARHAGSGAGLGGLAAEQFCAAQAIASSSETSGPNGRNRFRRDGGTRSLLHRGEGPAQGLRFGRPEEAVGPEKQRRIFRAARVALRSCATAARAPAIRRRRDPRAGRHPDIRSDFPRRVRGPGPRRRRRR